MKKYLFVILAAFGLAACAEKIDDNSPVHSGEVESSYIAVSLTAADIDTRADGGVYQEGLEAERAVETAYFFFFDQDGDPFTVNETGEAPGTDADENAKNYLQASLTTTGSEMNNVSDIKNVVLLLKNYEGEYPNQIVAVLNWVPTYNTYTLENLQGALVDVRNTSDTGNLKGKFVMSNAVYATDATPSTAVVATPLTAADIFTDEANAKANPITIHVERLAAKVTVTTTGGNKKFDLNEKIGTDAVYAKILGWELYNDYQTSHLLKNIDSGWTDLGFTWNDAPWYRCYWTTSQTGTFPDNTFQWEYATTPDGYANENGYGFGTAADVTAGTYAENTYAYCGENTRAATADSDPRTKIILKAQLVKDDNTAVELARWYTTEYLGEEDLRTAVANTLKYSLYYKETPVGYGDKYIGLKPEDLQCVAPEYDSNGNITNGAPDDIEPYEVFFQLSTTGQGKEWYKSNGSGVYTPIGGIGTGGTNIAETNVELAKVEPAVLYASGQTYYYIDVKHLGNGEGKAGDYGIVRNHIYSININSIGGYGSPVYFSTSNIVTPEYPIDPSETGSFVAAEVRILSWRLVSQSVNIQPQS